MKSLVLVLSAALLLGGCALRPFYREVVLGPEATAEAMPAAESVSLQVLDADSGAPVSGADVSFMQQGRRIRARSDANGTVVLPFSQALLAENPIVEVVLPAGVRAYRLQRAQPAS